MVAAFFLVNALLPKKLVWKTEPVITGQIIQEVSETGSVKKGEALNLNFKNGGIVQEINVSQGQEVLAGQLLAKLDSRQVRIQMAQAQAAYEAALLQWERLRRGADSEDIAVIESQVLAAQTAFETSARSLDAARANADQALKSARKAAADALLAAYTRSYNAYNYADLLQRTYFLPQDDDSIAVWELLQKMNLAVGKIKNYSQTAQNNGQDDDLSAAQTELAAAEARLRDIRAICEKDVWRDAVSLAHKENLDLHISYVVAARTAFNSAAQAVVLQKSANDLAVNSAAAAMDNAAAAKKIAQDQYAKVLAAPAREDLGVLEAQISQTKAQIALLRLQIEDSELTAPVNGRISQINYRAGETISPMAAVPLIVFLPDDPYEIFVNIYEEDTVRIKIGDPARIAVVALGDKIFSGRVSFVAAAAKIINGVVYYETRIMFDQAPDGLLPDMTADVEIITAQKDNVLLISETALHKKDGGWYAQILKDGQAQEIPVQIGIRAKGIAEIVSGLAEGDQVIIP